MRCYRYFRRLFWLVFFFRDFSNMRQPSANMSLFFKKTTNSRLFTMQHDSLLMAYLSLPIALAAKRHNF